MKKILVVFMTFLLALPALGTAATIDQLEKRIQDLQEEIDDLNDRTDKNEMHVATDRIQFSGDLRVRAHSLSYSDIKWPAMQAMMGIPGKYDVDNDIVYNTRLRLNMNAKVWDNVDFSGRLSMYKGWGDSTGVKMMDSFGAVLQDGTNGGNPTGDELRVERAYFVWKDIADSNFYLSIGRRPSTYGPPSQYRENEMRGGTPSGHLVHFNFDGVTLGYNVEGGLEGMKVRFCYGQGYDAGFGNGSLMYGTADLDDTHLGGFNVDILDDGTNFLQFTLFKALDITDGFTALTVMPMIDTDGDGIPDGPNTNGFVSRMQASTNIGDLWIGGLGFAREEQNGLKYFASFGWSQTDPNGQTGMFGGLLSDMPSTEKEDGYSAYVGVQVPAPMGKFGLEYNWGSEYWFNFTQAQDDMIGPKLATRGDVYEAYYIFDVNPRTFIKLAGLFYDYEYTGSGAPVGMPLKIEDVSIANAMNVHGQLPIVDEAYDVNVSMTINF